MPGVFTLTGTTGSIPGGQANITPQTISGNVAIGEVLALALVSGDNTITVPAGAIGLTVIPPYGNTTTIKYRSSLGASPGEPINPGNGFFTTNFPATPPTTIILNAASAIGAFTQIWFI